MQVVLLLPAWRMLAHQQHGCHCWLLQGQLEKVSTARASVLIDPVPYSMAVTGGSGQSSSKDIQLVTHLFSTMHLEV